jgi:hypothetical protein
VSIIKFMLKVEFENGIYQMEDVIFVKNQVASKIFNNCFIPSITVLLSTVNFGTFTINERYIMLRFIMVDIYEFLLNYFFI